MGMGDPLCMCVYARVCVCVQTETALSSQHSPPPLFSYTLSLESDRSFNSDSLLPPLVQKHHHQLSSGITLCHRIEVTHDIGVTGLRSQLTHQVRFFVVVFIKEPLQIPGMITSLVSAVAHCCVTRQHRAKVCHHCGQRSDSKKTVGAGRSSMITG